MVPDEWGDELGVVRDVEDIIYSFITIMLEYSMRLKDGWKVSSGPKFQVCLTFFRAGDIVQFVRGIPISTAQFE